MDEAIHRILIAEDSAEGDLESPSSLTYEKYVEIKADIETLKQEIEALTGKTLDLEIAQDASYMAQLWLYRKAEEGPYEGSNVADLAIKFSNFGRLVMVWSQDSETLQKYPLDDIISALRKRGFTVIPKDALEEPYDGRHKVPPDFTWLDRFFSYL